MTRVPWRLSDGKSSRVLLEALDRGARLASGERQEQETRHGPVNEAVVDVVAVVCRPCAVHGQPGPNLVGHMH